MKDIARMAKLLTLLTPHKTKFDLTPVHHTAFMMLKEAIIQAPILHYPDPARRYIVYTDTSDDACRAQLSQEHDGAKFPIVFLSHTFTETQPYAVTKWNYYHQGDNIIVCNDHKPLAKFLNGKNANNKVNRWGLEIVTYNTMFKWISGAWNKAATYLSRVVKLLNNRKGTIKMLTATISNGTASNTRSKTSHQCQITRNTEPSSTQPNKEMLQQT